MSMPKSTPDDRPPTDELTEREQQVMTLVASGLINKEVAAELHIRPATVKSHLSRIFMKLGAGNRVEAVLTFLDMSKHLLN